MKLHHATLAISAAALLAGCGGGGSSEFTPLPAASNEVPASATASTSAYAQYVASLVASETAMPLDVSKVSPPTSETESPQPI